MNHGYLEAGESDTRLEFTPRLQRAYFEIQKLRLDKAHTLLDQERSQNPDNGALIYLDNYADMYYLLISEDKAAFDRLSEKEDSRLDALTRLPENSPFQRLLRAEVRLHWAFAKLKFGSEVSACWDIIKAYKLLEENRRKFPTFVPTFKSLGLLHVLIGSVPEQYTWVTKVLGLTGDIEGGLRELNLVQAKDPFFRQEAQLIDLLLHAYTLQLSTAQIMELKAMPASQPDNLLLHFFATSVLMKEGRSEEALMILNKAPRTSDYIPFPFLDYLRAEILLQKGQYDQAYTYYDRFQRDFRGFNFLKDSYFKQFLCRWLTNRNEEAKALIGRVVKVGKTITESDQYAEKFAETYRAGQVKDEQKVLFEARYASDGGYLQEAEQALGNYSETSFSETSNKAEFNYRRGRILQKMGQSTQSLPYFERSIVLTQNTNLYFGPSSALQMGYIYKRQSNKPQAIASFKKAMSYKKHEYKNSIDNKARAALSELGA
ncbi:hypothetical protein GBK04_03025 [Cytophagaceae bacterium SJW1-29]|uniref:Uncharacterized protein n=1 Tax=Salmonirosea aquatica TaxID=2654236 RepID=A0A7C9F2A5_9BACT|nr:hypothetical protein [Cytophagaceae bacterium SJW1-29]